MRRTLGTAGSIFLLLLATGCAIDIGGPGPATDITFVQDAEDPSGPHLELDGFELFSDGGIGIETQGLDGVRSVSYTMAWDSAIASFAEAKSTPLGGLPEESTLSAELLEPGLLAVHHAVTPGATATLGGLLHVIEFDACESCSGETGMFVRDIVVLDAAGREVATTARGGRLVVTRLR